MNDLCNEFQCSPEASARHTDMWTDLMGGEMSRGQKYGGTSIRSAIEKLRIIHVAGHMQRKTCHELGCENAEEHVELTEKAAFLNCCNDEHQKVFDIVRTTICPKRAQICEQ